MKKRVLLLFVLIVLAVALFASCSCVSQIDLEDLVEQKPQTESTTVGSDATTGEQDPETSTPDETTTNVDLETTDPDETTTSVDPETTDPDETTTSVDLETTDPDETTTSADPETTDPDETTTGADPETTDPDETMTSVDPEIGENVPETEDPNPGNNENLEKTKLIVKSTSANAGDTVTLFVAIENNPGFLVFALNIEYDDSAITLTKVANGSEFSDYTFTKPKNMSSGCKAAWFSVSVPDEIVDGDVLVLTFKVSDNAAKGNYNVTVSDTKDGSNQFEFDDAIGYVAVK